MKLEEISNEMLRDLVKKCLVTDVVESPDKKFDESLTLSDLFFSVKNPDPVKKPVFFWDEPFSEELVEKPLVESSESPLVESSESPLVESSESPLVESSESPLVESSESPLVESSESPLVESSESPLVESSESPLVESSESPLVESSENLFKGAFEPFYSEDFKKKSPQQKNKSLFALVLCCKQKKPDNKIPKIPQNLFDYLLENGYYNYFKFDTSPF